MLGLGNHNVKPGLTWRTVAEMLRVPPAVIPVLILPESVMEWSPPQLQ